MITNIQNDLSLETNYSQGLLPQRNQKGVFYNQTSCRSNLGKFQLSSENRRILRKIEEFSYEKVSLSTFNYTNEVQRDVHFWIKGLGWEFPTSSVKNIFTNHIFNYVYVWKDDKNNIIAYLVCLFTNEISHAAYAFYDPKYSHGNLPIGMVLQVVKDSYEMGLKYCYLGRFSKDTGFYKRNMPGFEYFTNNTWQPYT